MAGFRDARKRKGWSQKETAARLGIPYMTYRRYETREREPSYDTLARIAEVLGVTTDYLIGKESSRQAEETKSASVSQNSVYRRFEGTELPAEDTENLEFMLAMHGASRYLNSEDREALLRMAKLLASKNTNN